VRPPDSGPPRRGPRDEAVRAYPVMHTVRALERLAFRPLSAPELALALQVHPRTARRLLRRLAVEDYVTPPRDARRRYQLTLRLAALGRQAIAHADWARRAAPSVAELAAQTGCRTGLWIPCYADVVCIVDASPQQPLPEPQLGGLLAAHASAPGKALLAYREPWRESLLARPLERYTDDTLTDPRDLRAALDRARVHGYAVDAGEHDPQTHGVAAPVVLLNETIAALGIQLAAKEAGATSIDTFAERVVAVAAALGDSLRPS
jgi:IclR family transcriptional regulator, acetate operon repressor